MRFFRNNTLINVEKSYSHSEGGWDCYHATFTAYEIETDLKWWAVRQLPKLSMN